MKLVIKRGFWLAVGLVVALFWAELYTRVLLPQSVDSVVDIQEVDPVLGFSFIPNSSARSRDRSHDIEFNINSLGFRNCEIDVEKKDNFRVLLFGNSFAVSHGCEMEESLCASFERALGDEFAGELGGRKIEVINASNFGYRTFNYWRGYQKWVDILKPDVVIVSIVPSRDYITFNEDVNFIVQDGLVVGRYRAGKKPVASKLAVLNKVRKKLARNSEFYVLCRNYIYYNEKISKLIAGKDKGASIMLASYKTPLTSKVKSGWEKSFEYISKIKEAADNDSIPLSVMLIPGKIEINENYFHGMLNDSTEVDKYDLEQPNRYLKEFCSSQKITMLNPHSDMMIASKTSSVYFEFNPHWNSHGIKIAARSMAKQWRKLGLPIE
jgi:hypothetical protein